MRRALIGGVCLTLAFAGGCAHERVEPADAPFIADDVPVEEAVAAHNARVALLDRLWARAVVTLRFTTADGDRRTEQGNGHFQLRDAERLALSIGKVGEVLVWIGADAERYWLLDRLDVKRAFVGRHDAITPERMNRSGLPVPPRDLLTLGGLRAIDADSAAVALNAEGERLVTVTDEAGAWRYRFAPPPADDIPLTVERLDDTGEPFIEARLEDPRSVRITDVSAFGVRSFGRLFVTHLPSGDSISILLDGDLEDGRSRGVPRKQVFDLDVLLNAYGPFEEVIDLDAGE